MNQWFNCFFHKGGGTLCVLHVRKKQLQTMFRPDSYDIVQFLYVRTALVECGQRKNPILHYPSPVFSCFGDLVEDAL